jgi:hypothetical protein
VVRQKDAFNLKRGDFVAAGFDDVDASTAQDAVDLTRAVVLRNV